MDSSQLTPAQAAAMVDGLSIDRTYVARLKARMEEIKFPSDDKLYSLTVTAQSALQDLFVALHYMSCAPGSVGKPAE